MVCKAWETEEFKQWVLEELYKAYLQARRGKRGTHDECAFEMNCLQNLVALRDVILAGEYQPSRGIAFVVRRPVIREIFAAPFRDRIVHHFLNNLNADWWDRRMIYRSYSCRKGKGTLFGVKQVHRQMRQISQNGKRKCYYIKLDIQGYFMSLPRDALYLRIVWGLKRQYPRGGPICELCKYLWREVIFDDPVVGVKKKGTDKEWEDLPRSKSLFCQPLGRGIVIGNLSSQLLSNIYLDSLDQFVTKRLGYKYYGRYVDDFYILVTEEQYEQAKRDVRLIERFLLGLELKLHPRKRYYQNIQHGMAFLGAVIYPDFIVPGKRVLKNFYQAARQFAEGEKELATVISYMGTISHYRHKKVTKKLFDKMGWEYRF